MPCSPETAPPSGHAGAKMSSQQRVAAIVVGLEYRQVDVAVADVAAPGDEGAVAARPGRRPGPGSSGMAARGTTASMMSSAPAAFDDEERPLPGGDQLRARRRRAGRRRRGHRARRAARPAHRRPPRPGRGACPPARRPGRPAAAALTSSGMPRSMPAFGGDAGHRQHVDVLEDATGRRRWPRSAAPPRPLGERGEGRQHGGRRGEARVEPSA